MIKENDSNLTKLYVDLIDKFMELNKLILYSAMMFEVLYMILLYSVDALERTIQNYCAMYIIRPVGLMSLIYWPAHIYLKYLRRNNKVTNIIAIVPLVVSVGICTVLIRVHYIFPALYGIMALPTCLSLAFGSKKIKKLTTGAAYLAATIAFTSIYIQNRSDIPKYYEFNIAITYIIISITSMCTGYMIEFERAKDSLVCKYHKKSNALKKEAKTDSLTGLLNLKAFTKIMRYWMQDGKEFAFSIIDIDNFKRVNDTYGHSFGNVVLKRLAHILLNTSSDDIVVARYGGEEFCLIIRGSNTEELKEIVDKVRREFKSQTYRETEEIFSFSGGIAS